MGIIQTAFSTINKISPATHGQSNHILDIQLTDDDFTGDTVPVLDNENTFHSPTE
jgi:hypothetical protein